MTVGLLDESVINQIHSLQGITLPPLTISKVTITLPQLHTAITNAGGLSCDFNVVAAALGVSSAIVDVGFVVKGWAETYLSVYYSLVEKNLGVGQAVEMAAGEARKREVPLQKRQAVPQSVPVDKVTPTSKRMKLAAAQANVVSV